jgi:hypothetical protein
VHLDKPGPALESLDFAAEAARRFLLAHPPPADRKPAPVTVEPAAKPATAPDSKRVP